MVLSSSPHPSMLPSRSGDATTFFFSVRYTPFHRQRSEFRCGGQWIAAENWQQRRRSVVSSRMKFNVVIPVKTILSLLASTGVLGTSLNYQPMFVAETSSQKSRGMTLDSITSRAFLPFQRPCIHPNQSFHHCIASSFQSRLRILIYFMFFRTSFSILLYISSRFSIR